MSRKYVARNGCDSTRCSRVLSICADFFENCHPERKPSCVVKGPAFRHGYFIQDENDMRKMYAQRGESAKTWDFASAVPSWNHMAAACGLPTTLPAAVVFSFTLPTNSESHECRPQAHPWC
jgi:hypothetical protein